MRKLAHWTSFCTKLMIVKSGYSFIFTKIAFCNIVYICARLGCPCDSRSPSPAVESLGSKFSPIFTRINVAAEAISDPLPSALAIHNRSRTPFPTLEVVRHKDGSRRVATGSETRPRRAGFHWIQKWINKVTLDPYRVFSLDNYVTRKGGGGSPKGVPRLYREVPFGTEPIHA